MADKRKEDIPFGSLEKGQFDFFLWNSFFDDVVQSVLATRKRLNFNARQSISQTPETDRWLLAWPIKAFRDVTFLVYDVPKYWQDPLFPTFYDWDPEFISHLLMVVTNYKNLPPNKWDLTRAVAECPREQISRVHNPKPFLETAMGPISDGEIPAPASLRTYSDYICRPLDFLEIEKIINDTLPHLKSSSTRTDNLRKGVFYKERKKRRGILDDWAINFSANERVLIPEDLSTVPCSPHPDYYKIPPEKSVPKKSAKK
ncbi:MAG TPA: hypothetical protein VG347_24845 [Verrucomicrobiae bacterium]|nr:hypothetical protein [Verrucomicrobiae bacterium]